MPVNFRTSVEHIIVLMLENRSFDHMCGWLGRGDGLQRTMFNPRDPANPASPKVFVTKDADWLGDLTVDPSHAVLDVNVQLFGSTIEPSPPVATRMSLPPFSSVLQGLASRPSLMHLPSLRTATL